MSATDQNTPSVGASRNGLFERLRALFGFEGATAREDVKDAIDEAVRDGGFSEKETVILKNVLALHELRVADVLVPRADIIAVEIETTLGGILSVFRTASHSRLPVYAETLDDPRGMVHILDFVDFLARSAESRKLRQPPAGEAEASAGRPAGPVGLDLSLPLSQANILRPVLYAPPSMPALDLLIKMQASHTHMALVIDEYGGTDGLVSIEDIMEMIVGDIEDEHDETASPEIETAPDGALIMSARTSLEAVAEKAGVAIATEDDRGEVDTIGGLVASIAGRLPVRGEIIRISPEVEVEIMEADPRKLKRLKLRKTIAPGAMEASDALPPSSSVPP